MHFQVVSLGITYKERENRVLNIQELDIVAHSAMGVCLALPHFQ